MRAAVRSADAAIACCLGLLVLAVHDVGYLTSTPYWLDESWVAVSTRVSLGELPVVSASSPLGWTLLLRLVPGSSPERQRLLPLAFAAIAVALAYLLARSLGFGRVWAGIAGAAPALLVPAMLTRNDLKQYTADAAVFLLIFLLVSRLESAWSRRRLLHLAAVVALSPLLSTAAVFAGAAAFASLLLACLIARERRRLRDTAVVGAAAGTLLLVLLGVTVQRNSTPALRSFWVAYYLPRSPSGLVRTVGDRLAGATPYLGLHHAGAVVALLALGALAVGSRRPASGLLVPLSFVLTASAALAHAYPFLDIRTSTWLLVGSAVLMALGLASVLHRIAALGLPGRLASVLATALLAGVAWHGAQPYVRVHSIFPQDVRSQANYVRAHASREDVVLVSLSASWAYAYYSPGSRVRIRTDTDAATGFLPDFSADPRVVAMTARGAEPVRKAVAEAIARLTPGGHVWVVRTQVAVDERGVWNEVRDRCGRELQVGVDPLLVLDPARGC